MNTILRDWLLRFMSSAYPVVNRLLVFRLPAQDAHDKAIKLIRLIEGMPWSTGCARLLHRLQFSQVPVDVGGVKLSQRLILAAGLVKGDGFASEDEAMSAVGTGRRNIIPGWRFLPALLGPAEFGSFTRFPRLGNPGTVVWRHPDSRSTQNRIGLRNPGARAAARFLADHRKQLPRTFGINIAVSPGVVEIDRQAREVVESLAFFLDAGVEPNWFTLNLSCPNTEDDPQGHQLEAETKRLCGAVIAALASRGLAIPLWVKISPGLTADQYAMLVRIFSEAGVKAVVATNTLARPIPAEPSQSAGVGGGALLDEALTAIRLLRAAQQRYDCDLDLIACGGILDGASFRAYQDLGVTAGQYWSALVYRGPVAAAIIENELARNEQPFETVHRESLA